MNWDYNLNKQYQEEQRRRAETERLAQAVQQQKLPYRLLRRR